MFKERFEITYKVILYALLFLLPISLVFYLITTVKILAGIFGLIILTFVLVGSSILLWTFIKWLIYEPYKERKKNK